MDNVEFKTKLWDFLNDIHPHDKRSDTQLSIRCPFCGDSSKSYDSTHFYIKIDVDNDKMPVLFNCFLCNTSGIMSSSVMRTIGIFDNDVLSSLTKYNNAVIKNNPHLLGVVNNNIQLIIPVPLNTEQNETKKKYIEDRLKIKLTFEEMAELKIVTQLGHFLKVNKIDKMTVSKEKAQALHSDYVGFVTMKNEFINFRRVNEKSKFKRYEKYSIFNSLDNTRKFYTIPNSVSLLSNEEIVLNIAEGVFDILGIYYHIYNKKKENTIYAAVCGSGYVSVIKYFIKMGVFGNVILNIYSDSDKSKYFYKDLVNEIKPWVKKINLYYNELEHDYGHPKSKIRAVKQRL